MNKTLWAIDNELDEAKFERLCVDLLRRHGFLDITPIEPQDGGRDAEELPRKGRSREGHPAFFQFSKEEDWKRKLRRDAKKLISRKSEFDTFVFVTSRKVRGVDVDALRTEFRETFGWVLIVFGREWLRLQLEEVHPDLAVRYLGTDVLSSPLSPAATVLFAEPGDLELKEINRLIEADQADAAVLQLKRILERNSERADALQLLAWAYYKLHRYEEALAEINRTLKREDKAEYRSIRACILAERGIRDDDRSFLLEARRIFEELLTSHPVHTWHIFYNLGNVLGALGEYNAAIERYQTAVELNERQPSVWKNLASAYHKVGNHDEEMRCFDRALELDPKQPEALISKANSLILDFQKSEEAIPLLELALTLHSDTLARWPYVCYWLALAHGRLDHLEKALDYIEQGLAHRPGDIATKRLKSHLLRKLSRRDPSFRARLQEFWKQELDDEPLNFEARRELVRAALSSGDETAAWRLIDESFGVLDIADTCSLRPSTFAPEACMRALGYLPYYARFRSLQPLSEYWDVTEPVYDLPYDPPPGHLIEGALRTYFAVPFGNGWRFLSSAKDRNDPATLVAFFDIVRDGIRTAASQATRYLAQVVPDKENGVEALAGKTTELMMFMALVALREFGKHRGYIMGYFDVPPASSGEAMCSYDEERLHSDVLIGSFTVLNEELAILRT
jgi:tetratricopeptide (TPR) repeat protein